ncbi:unnamed protein product [Nippostrongylus brasiliensis]|uniref:Uncharacterized protein n=1 Tax=Nippostrongylus brasiliensis TaxID=27835 RepID=A0A0N4YRW8_NIPBR|nr:unnamed protein product [Nippostrongylus brasiliensis]
MLPAPVSPQRVLPFSKLLGGHTYTYAEVSGFERNAEGSCRLAFLVTNLTIMDSFSWLTHYRSHKSWLTSADLCGLDSKSCRQEAR